MHPTYRELRCVGLGLQYARKQIREHWTNRADCTGRMKSTDIAVLKFSSENGQELTGVVAGVTEKGLAVLAPCWGLDLVDDLPATRDILEWTRISLDQGFDPLKVYDPETIGLKQLVS